jgi:hypothetical protein
MIITIFVFPYCGSFVIEMIYEMQINNCFLWIDKCICYPQHELLKQGELLEEREAHVLCDLVGKIYLAYRDNEVGGCGAKQGRKQWRR